MNDVRGEVPLTEREDEVVRLLRMGLSRGEVAEKMGIAYPTVRTHMRSVFGKLGVRSSAAALFVLEGRRKEKMAQDIRDAAARYRMHEKTLEETQDHITDTLLHYVDDPEVTQAIKEWEER